MTLDDIRARVAQIETVKRGGYGYTAESLRDKLMNDMPQYIAGGESESPSKIVLRAMDIIKIAFEACA